MRSTCLTGKKQTNGARPNVYFCRYCGGWHWGHGKTPINKAARGQ